MCDKDDKFSCENYVLSLQTSMMFKSKSCSRSIECSDGREYFDIGIFKTSSGETLYCATPAN